MPEVHTLYIVRTPHEINSKLCSHEGRICLIVPNYTEVFAQPIETKDDSVKCFQVEVQADEVVEQADGGKMKLLLWLGDPNARSRPQDMLTLPIASLRSIGGPGSTAAPGAVSPQDAAATLFAGYPDEVKLAGVIVSTDDAVLAKLPAGAGAIKAWATTVLSGSAKASSAKAG